MQKATRRTRRMAFSFHIADYSRPVPSLLLQNRLGGDGNLVLDQVEGLFGQGVLGDQLPFDFVRPIGHHPVRRLFRESKKQHHIVRRRGIDVQLSKAGPRRRRSWHRRHARVPVGRKLRLSPGHAGRRSPSSRGGRRADGRRTRRDWRGGRRHRTLVLQLLLVPTDQRLERLIVSFDFLIVIPQGPVLSGQVFNLLLQLFRPSLNTRPLFVTAVLDTLQLVLGRLGL